MVSAFLVDARVAAIDGGRVMVSFPPGAGFAKKKVEANRELVRDALAELVGFSPAVEYALSDEAGTKQPEGEPLLSEEELLQRLKDDFNAREIFDDDPSSA